MTANKAFVLLQHLGIWLTLKCVSVIVSFKKDFHTSFSFLKDYLNLFKLQANLIMKQKVYNFWKYLLYILFRSYSDQLSALALVSIVIF